MKKLSLISLLIVAFFTTATYAQDDFQVLNFESSDNSTANGDLVNQWFQSKLAGDFATMESLMSEDFVIMGVDGNPTLSRAEYVETWKGYGQGNSEQGLSQAVAIPIHIKEGEMAGEWVIFTGEASWTPQPTGQEIISWFTTYAKIENGKIVLAYHFQDNLPVMMQMGFTLTPPSWATADGE